MAGPPSPAYPAVPSPATVEMVPSVAILRMTFSTPETRRTFPAASIAMRPSLSAFWALLNPSRAREAAAPSPSWPCTPVPQSLSTVPVATVVPATLTAVAGALARRTIRTHWFAASVARRSPPPKGCPAGRRRTPGRRLNFASVATWPSPEFPWTVPATV